MLQVSQRFCIQHIDVWHFRMTYKLLVHMRDYFTIFLFRMDLTFNFYLFHSIQSISVSFGWLSIHMQNICNFSSFLATVARKNKK